MRVVVGSHNPAKIEAVHTAFEKMGLEANITGVDVETGVSAQPFTDEETIEGAIHRAENSLNAQDGEVVDFGIGLEGGVVETPYGLFVCNWGAVVSKDGVVGIGGGHRVQLPDTIAQELREGRELGPVMDRWAGRHDIKKREGAIGVLTNHRITRVSMFRDVVICAFARFSNPQFFVGT